MFEYKINIISFLRNKTYLYIIVKRLMLQAYLADKNIQLNE